MSEEFGFRTVMAGIPARVGSLEWPLNNTDQGYIGGDIFSLGWFI
jgi:hypothetical protein